MPVVRRSAGANSRESGNKEHGDCAVVLEEERRMRVEIIDQKARPSEFTAPHRWLRDFGCRPRRAVGVEADLVPAWSAVMLLELDSSDPPTIGRLAQGRVALASRAVHVRSHVTWLTVGVLVLTSPPFGHVLKCGMLSLFCLFQFISHCLFQPRNHSSEDTCCVLIVLSSNSGEQTSRL